MYSKTLLPSGFRDLLPPEAQTEEDAVSVFLETFRSFGYQRVKPPLLEFEDNLFAEGPGAFLKDKAFRFIDPVSQKMMALRCDITAQIARIASSRFAGEDRPLRLMYANDVLRTQSSQQRVERQFRQVGCEIIGDDHRDADIEIAVVAIQGVKALGIETVTVDLSYPQLIDDIFTAYATSDRSREELIAIMERKDLVTLAARAEPVAALLLDILQNSGPVLQTIEVLKAHAKNDAIVARIARLESVAMGLKNAVKSLGVSGIDITIDPCVFKAFSYHSGVCFTLYSAQALSEIGRGGRYMIPGGESACGFTVYMDTVLKITKPAPAQENVYVDSSVNWAVIRDLQAHGWIVIRGIANYPIPKSCTHIYKDGEVIEVKK